MKYKLVVLSVLMIMCWNLMGEQLIIRFNNPDESILNTFRNSTYDEASFVPGDYLDIVVSEDTYEQLLEDGYTPEIFRTESDLKANLNSGRLAGYTNYEDILSELQMLEILYPETHKLYDIGDTWGKIYSENGNSVYDDYNHEIWALKISDNVALEEDEPNIYYMATHHAREPISTETCLKVMNHITDNYGVDPELTENVNNSQIWIIPLVNPNGHKLVTDETYTMWRKNIRDNNENNTIEANGNVSIDGVDPNRNYGHEWGLIGSSDDFTDYTYHGPEAFSEPENQAIANLVSSHNFIAGLSYHSYSELVLYPFGYADGVSAPDYTELSLLAETMAATIPKQNGGTYTPSAAWELYACQGTSDDYLYGEHGIFAYTVELATEFIPPANQVDEIASNNIESAMIILNRMNEKMITGHVTDAVTGDPIEAEIYISEIDDSGVHREPYSSDATFGSYYRFLPVDIYSISYSAYGYDTVTVNDVLIMDGAVTTQDVQLTPSASTFPVVGLVVDGISGDPISNAKIIINNLEENPVYSNLDGTFVFTGQYTYNMNFSASAQDYANGSLTYLVNPENNSPQIMLYPIQNDGFESGELSPSWIQSGNQDWTITNNSYEGSYAIKSGNISHGQNSGFSISYEVAEDSQISFAVKASSEQGYDFLYFHLDGEVMGSWSGEQNWEEVSYNVSAGYHEFSWSYNKDDYATDGSDCGWLDSINLPGSVGTSFYPPQNFEANNSSTNQQVFYNLYWEAPESNSDQVTGYNIYEDYELRMQVGADVYQADELYAANNSHSIWYVTAVYGTPENESAPSEILDIEPLVDSNDDDVLGVTKLEGNYPNPFNPSTTIKFSLKNSQQVQLSVYNIKGQLVHTLKNELMEAGSHSVIWNGIDKDGNSVTSGIYFSRLKAGAKSFNSKMILLK